MNRRKKYNISFIMQCSVFAAMICILSPLTVPVGAVPMSLSTFAVVLSAVVLGCRKSVVAALIYILLGAVGLPVFSGWQAGVGVLIGPTGGYVWSYVAVCAVVGKCVDMRSRIAAVMGTALAAMVLCYLCGVLWYMAVVQATFIQATAVCVYPFVVFDIIKVVAAVIIGERIRSGLINSGFVM